MCLLTPPIELAGEALELVGLGAKVPRHDDLAEQRGVHDDEGVAVGHPRQGAAARRVGQRHHELLGEGGRPGDGLAPALGLEQVGRTES